MTGVGIAGEVGRWGEVGGDGCLGDEGEEGDSAGDIMGDGDVGRWGEVGGEGYERVEEDCGLLNGGGDDGTGGPQPLHGRK